MFLRTGHQCSSPALSPPRCAARCCAPADADSRRRQATRCGSAQATRRRRRGGDAVGHRHSRPGACSAVVAADALELLAILGIHRLGAVEVQLARQAVVIGEAVDLVVLAGQPIRHVALGPHDLGHDRARVGRHLLREIEPILGAADQRLGQIHGVVRDDDPGQVVLVLEAPPHQVLGQRRFVALRHAVAAVVVFLHVRRLDAQPVAFPRRPSRSRPTCAPRTRADAGGRPYRSECSSSAATRSGTRWSARDAGSTSFQTRRFDGPRLM